MSHFTTGQVVTSADLNALHSLIAEATADGTSTTLSISSIPQTHRDLLIVVHGSHNGTALEGCTFTINGDTSSYRYVRVDTNDNGNPTTQSSQSASSWGLGVIGDDGFLSGFRLELADYTNANNQFVTWQIFGTAGTSAGQSRSSSGGGSHVQSAAVTSIQTTISASNWGSGSTLKVYGLGMI